MISITSTDPMTVPSSSQTGNDSTRSSCMICSASKAVTSGNTWRGCGVMMLVTVVTSNGTCFATAFSIIFFTVTIPTSLPESTTSAALSSRAIMIPASKTLVSGLTIVEGLPVNKLLSVGDVLLPNACSKTGPNKACRAFTWAPVPAFRVATCSTTSFAALMLHSSARSSF